jgi:hypothetical protein
MKRLPVFVVLLFLCLSLPAQDFDHEIDSLLAVLRSHKEEDWMGLLQGNNTYHMIYTQAGFENKTYFAGRDIGVEQFNLMVSTSYHYRGITAFFGGMVYPEFEPRWYASVLSLSYGNTVFIPFPLDLQVGYDRSFLHAERDTLTAMLPNNIHLGAGYAAKRWGVHVNYSLLFGSDISSQLSGSLSAKQMLFRWKNGNKLRIEPTLSLLFADEESIYYPLPGGNRPPVIVKTFGLLNTVFHIPLVCYWGDADISLGFQYNIPRSTDGESEYDPTYLFTVSAGYVLGFKGK